MPFGFHRSKDKDQYSNPSFGTSPPGSAGYQEQQQQFQQLPTPGQYPSQQQYGAPMSPTSPISPTSGVPEFRMFRSTTTTQEQIFAPNAPADVLKREQKEADRAVKKDRRLSERLGLRRHHSSASQNSGTSEHVPQDLVNAAEGDKEQEDRWEWRASQLGMAAGGSGVDVAGGGYNGGLGGDQGRPRSRSRSHSDVGTDTSIQEGIRLHEAGDLTGSAEIFRRLADPNGANNPLSQVLYGLALRHAWGIPKNDKQAIFYLQAAAANSAGIEQEALRAGMKKGGAAKGELVLAIYELGNCYRHGWGTEKDPVAAFNYYQTAANLGDTDAMNETAWCYLNGYGMKKKDKYLSAKYYRLAEENGNKTVGNSWIYKDKYVNPR